MTSGPCARAGRPPQPTRRPGLQRAAEGGTIASRHRWSVARSLGDETLRDLGQISSAAAAKSGGVLADASHWTVSIPVQRRTWHARTPRSSWIARATVRARSGLRLKELVRRWIRMWSAEMTSQTEAAPDSLGNATHAVGCRCLGLAQHTAVIADEF
jgi:hypothetical protein